MADIVPGTFVTLHAPEPHPDDPLAPEAGSPVIALVDAVNVDGTLTLSVANEVCVRSYTNVVHGTAPGQWVERG